MNKNQNVKLELTDTAKKRLRHPVWGFKEKDVGVAVDHLGGFLEGLSLAITKRERNIAEAEFDRLFKPVWGDGENWEREALCEEIDIVSQEFGSVIGQIIFVLAFNECLAAGIKHDHYSFISQELDDDEYYCALDELYPSPPERLEDLLYERKIVEQIPVLLRFFQYEVNDRFL